ncbi:MAG: NTP transferase domain-containing protein [Actinomycetes bacterium]
MTGFDAIVLAGGTSRRMGVESKTAITVGGHSLLDRAIDAVRDAERIVVVGPECDTSLPVIWARESPIGGGPAAAIEAGLTQLDRLPLAAGPQGHARCPVMVLAGDVPFAHTAVPRLLRAAIDADVAVLVDGSGRDQFLVAAWHPDALRGALSQTETTGSSVRALFDNARVARVLASGPEALDCDEPSDVERARELESTDPGSS